MFTATCDDPGKIKSVANNYRTLHFFHLFCSFFTTFVADFCGVLDKLQRADCFCSIKITGRLDVVRKQSSKRVDKLKALAVNYVCVYLERYNCVLGTGH